MTDDVGVPVRELSDTELERQGVRAHATRHWVFLHGTAQQFQTHTQRMLDLEQEYLRRHPQRTWQGLAGAEASESQVSAAARDGRIRDLIHTLSSEVLNLLDETGAAQPTDAAVEDPNAAQAKLLGAFASAPGGGLHKLEAHQLARKVSAGAHLRASMYKHQPPLLRAEGDQRVITDAGRAWLATHSNS